MKRTIVIIFTAMILGVLLRPVWSWADNASSTSFWVRDSSLGEFGGYASSTDFQVVNGQSPFVQTQGSSTDFVGNTGPVNYSEFTTQSQAWRWYGDDHETPTSPLAAEDVAPSNISLSQVLKLRLTIKETSGIGNTGVKFKIQFSQISDFSSGVFNVAELGASCTVASVWCYATSTGNDNALITTKLLSDSNSCSGGVGNGCGTHNTSGISVSTSTQQANAATEYEFTLTDPGGAPGTVYYFRAVDTGSGLPVNVNGTSTYPSLLTQGAMLSFGLSGLPGGTNTSGVITNVTTTPVSVPFGTLSVGTGLTAAQRLSVSTNASNGYELYLLQDSPLTDVHGDQIPGIAGTNFSPLPWNTGCAATSSGCYGYHSGDAILSGGSTRFAADDSYASFSTSTAEVGYSGTAVTSSSVDMVYKIQVAGNQGNGSYSNNIIYIVAPSF